MKKFLVRESIPGYFFLFFLGFLLGNLFPIFCTIFHPVVFCILSFLKIFQFFLTNIQITSRELLNFPEFQTNRERSALETEKLDFFPKFSNASTSGVQPNTWDLNLPNFFSAFFLLILYEIFSQVENFLSKQLSGTSQVRFRLGGSSEKFISTADIIPQSAEVELSRARKKSGNKRILILLRMLRSLKIGFFLGLFVDAFKVGS
jgi:hypothetical protein